MECFAAAAVSVDMGVEQEGLGCVMNVGKF